MPARFRLVLSLFTVLAGELLRPSLARGNDRDRDRDPSAENLLNVRVEAPTAVRVGDTVVLKCLYDLGEDSLYTMKWYRSTMEFYRYTPKESPPVKTFPSPGLSIDLSHSNATHLTLQRADLSLTGRYSCEVTTDFPNFIADVKNLFLRVVAYPDRKPELTLNPNKQRFGVGDFLAANCTSYRSKPAANLTWLINGKRVSSRFQQQERWKDLHNPSLDTGRTSLRLPLGPQHFSSGQLKLSCVAEITDLYHQTSEVLLSEEDRPKISSVVANSSYSGSGNSRFKPGASSGVSTWSQTIPDNLSLLGALFFLLLW